MADGQRQYRDRVLRGTLEEMKTVGVASSTYGLGLRKRTTSCGIEAYGNDGDALAYMSWSFITDDQRQQVTIALGPNFSGDPDDAIDAFLDTTFCKEHWLLRPEKRASGSR